MKNPTSSNQPLALIIEDDAKLSIIFSKALQDADFYTEIIKDGNTALERLAETTPSVVLLDLHLPQVSGDEILRQIRADERLSKTRVMLATADAFVAENLTKESDLVLLKPISFTQLRDLASRLRPRESVIDLDLT